MTCLDLALALTLLDGVARLSCVALPFGQRDLRLTRPLFQ